MDVRTWNNLPQTAQEYMEVYVANVRHYTEMKAILPHLYRRLYGDWILDDIRNKCTDI